MSVRKLAAFLCVLALGLGCGFGAGYKLGFSQGKNNGNGTPLTDASKTEGDDSGEPAFGDDYPWDVVDDQSVDVSDGSETDSIDGIDSESSDSGNYTMTFVNVIGEEYETTILGSVPKHNYDFSCLDNSGEYYSYTDPATGEEAFLGIDVSKYQGEIDWQQVADAGVRFVIVRLGFRGYGSGSLNLDPMFEEYVKGARDAGLIVGVYFYSQAISSEEALEEADYVLDHIQDFDINGPVVFDTEMVQDDPEARTIGVSGEVFTDCCVAFCDRIREAGYKPMIYFNMLWQVFTLDVTRLTDYEKWYADYEPVPQSPYEFSMWQYSERGSVPGIQGGVDLNLWF